MIDLKDLEFLYEDVGSSKECEIGNDYATNDEILQVC